MKNNYTNLEETARSRNFGNINVKRYKGNNTILLEVNELADELKIKYIGKTQFIKTENTWYLEVDPRLEIFDEDFEGNKIGFGLKFRLPESDEGIESVLDVEFKRQDL